MYDIRGADGTGTSVNPVDSSSSNAKAYTIRKLADGNCWMSEDLYFPLSGGVSVEASYNDGTIFTYVPTSCSGDGKCGVNRNTKAGTGSYANYYYYNWFAATAEKGNASFPTNTDIDGSICPKGWKLPSNYSVEGTNPATGTLWRDMSWAAMTKEYLGVTVGTNLDITALDNIPISLQRAGYYGSGNGPYYAGSEAQYWMSTANNNTDDARRFSYRNNYVGPQGGTNPDVFGFSVRCLAVR